MYLRIKDKIIHIPSGINGVIAGIGKDSVTIELDRPIKRVIDGKQFDQWIVVTSVNNIKQIQLSLFD